MEKKCSTCGEIKPIDQYSFKSTAKGTRQARCKSCQSAAVKSAYKADPKKFIERSKKFNNSSADWFRMLKEGKPCTDCKVSYPACVMDFDHLSDKEFSIGSYVRRASKARILKEIEKCELVCANCHRIRTHNRRTAQSSSG